MASSDISRVAVVATAQTTLRPSWDNRQHVDLIYAAVTDVLAGSGLSIADVDVVIDCGSDVLDGRSISNCGFLGAMGAHHKEESRVEEDGLWGLLYARNKIAAGGAKVALVVAYSKPSESDVAAYYASIAEPFYQRPVGLGQVAALGLMANQYLAARGLPEDVLTQVAAHNWARAFANANVETEPIDAAAIDASAMVAEPLRALQIARPLDGAVAVLLAQESIARKSSAPVWITGTGTASAGHLVAERAPGELPAAATAAATAYRRAGISDATAFDVAEISGASAAGELMVLEALGLAEVGKAVGLYADGAPITVNPSGGAIPADPIMATGLIRLAEATEQLSGRIDRGGRPARTAVVHGSGGLAMQNHAVVTLEV
ncbi:MAG: thiolase C-terminal domain-containing protein [Sporichthyaceae bacterium]